MTQDVHIHNRNLLYYKRTQIRTRERNIQPESI